MTTPTKEKLAEKLAATIYEHVASPLEQARERALAPFRGLRIVPTITVDPDDGTMSFSFAAGREEADVDATLERLLQVPAELGAAQRAQGGADLRRVPGGGRDRPLPAEAAAHRLRAAAGGRRAIYLGSKRHMMERLFNDENEPFWRSAKQVELGDDPAGAVPEVHRRPLSQDERKKVESEVVKSLLERTGGHPYATQELCYALWEATPFDDTAGEAELESALASVLRSEHAHFGADLGGRLGRASGSSSKRSPRNPVAR